MKNTEPNKPTGNLEELFRHHLAEAEVAPRPFVWDQIDNSLLIAQNETYRRRLRATRWVAAASLLLATLAGTGWWTQRELGGLATAGQPRPTASYAVGNSGFSTTPSAATIEQPVLSSSADAASQRQLARNGAGADRTSSIASQAAEANYGNTGREAPSPSPQLLAGSATRRPATTSFGVPHLSGAEQQAVAGRSTGPAARASVATYGLSRLDAEGSRARYQASASHGRDLGLTTKDYPGQPLAGLVAAGNAGVTNAETLAGSSQPTAFGQPGAIEPAQLLAVQLAGLNGPSPLPTPLPVQDVPADGTPAPVAPARAWRLGASYAVGAYYANMSFSSTPANPALGPASAALTQAAALEYEREEQPGLSQRLSLQANRRLGGRWALSTGLEVSEQDTRSTTSYLFTGEQLPDLGQPLSGGPARKVTSRYRSAGIPVELRYADPVKTGWSLYGRVGAAVTALLSARSDVEGEPEATRSYRLSSPSTPYRRVQTTLRAGAGFQYRPSGHEYTLSMGPVAEGGLYSLNAHPAEGLLSQGRPYSLGVEASVEFGRNPK